MKKINTLLFGFLLLCYACTSEESVVPITTPHFVINDSDKTMAFELTWKVNGQANGYNFVNLDLYFSDTLRMTEKSFFDASFWAANADWRGNPILMSSTGSNAIERIVPSTFSYVFVDPRKYLGFAINGLAEAGAGLTSTITIDYQIAVLHGEDKKLFTGSILYNPNLKAKTVVYYVATVDVNGLDNSYSFRQLTTPVRIVRDSDFVNTTQLDVTPGGSRTRDNDRLIARLEWSVNKNLPGYDFVDLDLYSGPILSFGYTGRSVSTTAYETIAFATYNVDFNRELGFTFIENKNKLSGPLTVTYTYTIYFADTPFKRFVYTSSFVTSAQSPGNTIIKNLKFTKQGNNVAISVL